MRHHKPSRYAAYYLGVTKEYAAPTPPGRAAGGYKLTPAQVEEARSMSATGRYTQKQIGAHFGVSQTCVSNALRRGAR